MTLLPPTPQLFQTGYDQSACDIGIVHIGYGAFHRAHQAVYVDDYMELSGDLRWGIAAVNLRTSEAAGFAQAQSATQGYLLKTMPPEGFCQYRLVRPHLAFSDWTTDQDGAEALLARTTVHAVTITVTESGYYLQDDWRLNTQDPVIAAEIGGAFPTSIYGFLARALDRRRTVNGQPITLMCCDNIRANGLMLEQNLLDYLHLTGRPDLADWLQGNASFPCSMVDRITPRSTQALNSEVEEALPGQSLAPIQGETFIQWVLQDRFAGPMPDLARAGVQIVEDVDPFEEAKIRILNGGHTGLCYLGALAGYDTFDAAMRDPVLRAHFDGWEAENVLPGLTIDLPFDKRVYASKIAARFSNSAISDQLERVCMDGWSKLPIYVRPTLEGCLAQGISPRYGYDSIASWYVYARRFAAGQTQIPYRDPYWKQLEPLLAPGKENDFARNAQLWADLPKTYDDFVPGVLSAIRRMEENWPA